MDDKSGLSLHSASRQGLVALLEISGHLHLHFRSKEYIDRIFIKKRKASLVRVPIPSATACVLAVIIGLSSPVHLLLPMQGDR